MLCNYNHEYHTCYATNSPCISEHEYTITWSSWCFLEVITLSTITIMHVYARRALKQKQKVSQDTNCRDFLYALYCSTCSLAQQYRALDMEENIIVECKLNKRFNKWTPIKEGENVDCISVLS